jgi:hypothetical protein
MFVSNVLICAFLLVAGIISATLPERRDAGGLALVLIALVVVTLAWQRLRKRRESSNTFITPIWAGIVGAVILMGCKGLPRVPVYAIDLSVVALAIYDNVIKTRRMSRSG